MISVKKYLDSSTLRKASLSLLLLVPILLYCWPILNSGAKFPPGDFDMQVQMTEAARISIVEYSQFPFWNPWISGGVPLFADPQFGLFTPQTLFSLVTDSAYAWKLTFVLYLIIGFLSMRKLLAAVGVQNQLIGILLSYVWIFNSFFMLRFNGGHFTFLLLLLLPLAVYLTLTFDTSRRRLLQLSLLLTYLMYASLHYSTILTLLVLGAFTVTLAVAEIMIKHSTLRAPWRKSWSTLRELKSVRRIALLVASIGIALALALPRLWLTLHYLHDSAPDRTETRENFFGILDGLKALFFPYGSYTTPNATYGPFEASNYIGMLTGIALIACFVALALALTRTRAGLTAPHQPSGLLIVIMVMTLVAFIVGLGGTVFYYLQQLPIFSSMRVSTRYFLIAAFGTILLTGILYSRLPYKKVRVGISLVLSLSVLNVALSNYHLGTREWVANDWHDTTSFSSSAAFDTYTPPRSEKLWTANDRTGEYKLTAATRQNRVQLITDNALVETRAIGTAHCDADEPNCSYIPSRNATLLYWSPLRIVLERTSEGPIVLNTNAGSHWSVNGQQPFERLDVVSSSQPLTVTNAGKIITLTYRPF